MATQVHTDLDFSTGAKITNLPAPTAAGDAVNKAYADSAIEGLAWKDSCRCSSASNVNLASPGATIDGITMAVNDRVLVRSQSTGSQNGIYIWNGAAVAMTRSLDASTADELEQAVVTVEEGTSAGTTYRQTAVNFVLDTGTVTFSTFGTSVGAATESTAGIAELATQAETDAGTDDARFITPQKLANYAGRAKRYATDVGDGSNTSYTITHNLNTRDVEVSVRRNSGAYDAIIVDVAATTVNTVTLTFKTAPTSNQFRAIVMA